MSDQESVVVPIRLPGDCVEKIDTFTREDGDNRSAWIRRAIFRAVKEVERRRSALRRRSAGSAR